MNKNLKNNLEKSNNSKQKNYDSEKKIVVKKKLMDKYGITDEEAEKVLTAYKNKVKQENIQKEQSQSTELNYQDTQKHINKQKNENPPENHINSTQHDSNKTNQDNSMSKKSNKIENENNKTRAKIKSDSNNTTTFVQSEKVDNIISDIIPNYNEQISIEVTNVNLTFNIINDKIDTLKETFIRTLKRNKSKKIKLHALKDISFKIYKGEKIGIIGYNGAGKSTLLNVICGIFPPDTGNVKTYGKISPLLSLGAGFDHNYSGRKNIFFNGAVLGYDKEFLKSKEKEIIEFSELGDFIDFPIKNYSSGMIAKLSFSIATAVEPDILVIDEILGVGDVNFQKKSRDKIKSLMDGGTTVLFVSHSIPQVRELCDKAIWIDNGSIKEIGEVNEVCDHYLEDAEKASNEQLVNIQLR